MFFDTNSGDLILTLWESFTRNISLDVFSQNTPSERVFTQRVFAQRVFTQRVFTQRILT